MPGEAWVTCYVMVVHIIAGIMHIILGGKGWMLTGGGAPILKKEIVELKIPARRCPWLPHCGGCSVFSHTPICRPFLLKNFCFHLISFPQEVRLLGKVHGH